MHSSLLWEDLAFINTLPTCTGLKHDTPMLSTPGSQVERDSLANAKTRKRESCGQGCFTSNSSA